MQTGREYWKRLAVTLAVGWLALGTVWGQPAGSAASGDLEKLIAAGDVAAVEQATQRLSAVDRARAAALAAVNRASRTGESAARDAAFEQARRRMLAWIEAAERQPDADPAVRTLAAATARLALGDMIVSRWMVPLRDRFELTDGQDVDRSRLVELLGAARDALGQAVADTGRLAEELRTGGPPTEDRFLALGIYDALRHTSARARFVLAWTDLHLAAASQPRQAQQYLQQAQRLFEELLDAGGDAVSQVRCRLGLAIALGRLGLFDEALRHFEQAARQADDPGLVAEVRYRQARCLLRAGRFEKARAVLKPLVAQDAAGQAARFYVNLALLWDANSYLIEARQRLAAGAGQAASRLRRTGLEKMYALARRGGAWPAVVAVYVADVVERTDDAATLSAAEVLLIAQQASARGDFEKAARLLRGLRQRGDVDARIEPEFLFELGRCEFKAGRERAAAEAFGALARRYKSHPNAQQALTYACELWAAVAERTGRVDDYRELANMLLLLLESFPEHPQRREAAWSLPLALESAGEYESAARHYAAIPTSDPRHDEAVFRRLLCRAREVESKRNRLSAAQLRETVQQMCAELKAYARQAAERAARSSDDADRWRRRAAGALVSAARLVALPQVGEYEQVLSLLADFETRYGDSGWLTAAIVLQVEAAQKVGKHDQAVATIRRFFDAKPVNRSPADVARLTAATGVEVDRLMAAGQTEQARSLARAVLPLAERVLARAVERGEEMRAAAQYELARLRWAAGELTTAEELTARLLEHDPRDGEYRRLAALVATALAESQSSTERSQAAVKAWEQILSDPQLRDVQPARYWEARYHYLALLLRLGQAAQVRQAIEQERVWYPDLGGDPWRGRLEALLHEAGG